MKLQILLLQSIKSGRKSIEDLKRKDLKVVVMGGEDGTRFFINNILVPQDRFNEEYALQARGEGIKFTMSYLSENEAEWPESYTEGRINPTVKS